MNWILYKTATTTNTYRIKNNNSNYITWSEFYELLKNNINIITKFIDILKSNPFDEYYLEFQPVESSTLNTTIWEFTLVKTSGFKNVDISSFSDKYLNTNTNEVKVFQNTGGDATLISPC